ncbi:MAG: tetratricopeptide repeat protein [Acidobacteria bacterium]|nr:tetratricopeptide repeat protein [Acidobacteriota bacterium]
MAPVSQQSWSRKELCRVLSLQERQLRTWEKQGLLHPSESYAFTDFLTIKTLRALKDQRVPLKQIRASFLSLRDRLPHLENPLAAVKISAEGRRIGVQFAGVKMEPVSGQLFLDFDTRVEGPRLMAQKPDPPRQREQADFWFQKGLELEQTGAPVEQAIDAYSKAIEQNPNAAGALVNLGTIFFHKRDWAKSEQYYAAAVAADPNYALAHYNLGNLYDERNDSAKAYRHYQEALRLHPKYADAHYNLALLHQGQGDSMRALSHWQQYLKLDPASQWANIARREIEKIKLATVLPGAKKQHA